MKYQLMQIQLSDAEVDAINAANDHGAIPKNKMRIAMQMDFSGSKTAKIAAEALSKGFYTHVANIEASDLDEVFEVGNIGPESAIERLNRMSSVSVGDVIVDEEGNASVVASFGFEGVDNVYSS
jgi:hypothetical protein